MKIKNILISQPQPTNSSPYSELIAKHKLNIDFKPFFRVEPLSAKEFRPQKINILDFSAVVFTSRSSIDAFFNLCEELRITVPESMKYFCITDAVALYLQKYIVYRKRKIFYGTGTTASIIEIISAKHKNETTLICITDSGKSELHRAFVKAKLKHAEAIVVKTVFNDLQSVNPTDYDMLVFYSPSDILSMKSNFPEFKQMGINFATFGPKTLKALKAEKITPTIIAPTPEAPSMAKALQNYCDEQTK